MLTTHPLARRGRYLATATAALLMASVATAAHAQVLTSGGAITPPTQTLNLSSLTFVIGDSFTDLSGSTGAAGSILYSAVFRDNANDLYFAYQVENRSVFELTNFEVQPFTFASAGGTQEFNTELFFSTTAPTNTALFTSTSDPSQGGNTAIEGAREADGGTVTFRFNETGGANSVQTGQRSAIQIVKVNNADNFRLGNVGILAGTNTDNTLGFVPSNVEVPEPGSLALAAPALLGAVGLVARRRRRTTVH